ncbi:MAG: Methyl-accepting chemotaxis protein 4 [Syntrophorhabdus sp. PtaU1.Bin050]|nr:MAG: Methyl-accepting chemotaxis protein 4 [Syntrophorhabdus sp. PtaU1.Bin050]
MKKVFRIVLIGVCVMMFTASVFAATAEDEAKAMVDKAIAFLKANGKDKGFAEINKPDGQFVKGDLYINVFSLSGTMLANGVNPKLIGVDGGKLQDPDGKMFMKEIIDRAASEGKGWVEYKWTNPKTKKIEPKVAYFVKCNDMIVSAGTYKK